jgi:hypothetical protein
MAITPETKDWTWVLQRPCPACGYDTSTVSRASLGRTLRDSTNAWHDVFVRPDVAVRPNDDTWSPLEYACHLRDAFGVLDGRLVLMLTLDDPTFPFWDQDATAINGEYAAQDPRTVARELDAAVAQIADRLDRVHEGQWPRPGSREEGARFTVESLGRYALHEPIHHLHDVTS